MTFDPVTILPHQRNKTGRKTEVPGERMVRTEVSVDPMTLRLLRVLGDGNVSKGVREAARVAYDRYQRS